VAYYDSAGLWLEDGAKIHCSGTPTAPVRFVDYRAVQEAPLKIGHYSGNSSGMGVYACRDLGMGSAAQFRFTAFSLMAGCSQAWDFYVNSPSWIYSSVEVKDCSFLGGGWWIAAGGDIDLTVVNNLFERATVNALGSYSWGLYNNLFKGGAVSFEPHLGAAWIV